MSALRPFFTFYGGKWRAAPRYPKPTCDIIVEPFAGSAGYSLHYPEREVTLVERDSKIATLWRYLIAATPDEILTLPDVPVEQSVDDLDVSDAAKYLIGFWLNKGAAQPCKRPSAWMRSGIRPKSYWGPEVRKILASQVKRIAHWKVIEGDFSESPNVEGTWFVDPPYERSGTLYRHSSRNIDFPSLAKWCVGRRGQVIVCEQEGATWLPFSALGNIKSTPGKRGKGVSKEVIWTTDLARAAIDAAQSSEK